MMYISLQALQTLSSKMSLNTTCEAKMLGLSYGCTLQLIVLTKEAFVMQAQMMAIF